jgi:hypothetical protein
MTLPVLQQADLALLRQWFPALRFERPDQIAALLDTSETDYQAAPGSGKTTMLGAKLALLAKKWSATGQGICVLSHTNVARIEIEGRLQSAPGGESLLSYPHYVGTIQTFVNRHIALPWLRSQGIELREIDEATVGNRVLALAGRDRNITGWMRMGQRDDIVKNIRYRGPNLDLVSSGGTLPGPGVCLSGLTRIKAQLARDGWLFHEDLFAYALHAVAQVPKLANAVAKRFPLVFIDEMQDTSSVQLDLLTAVFHGRSVVQRLGDSNQAILVQGQTAHAHSFPRKVFKEMSASLRFGQEIAGVANRIKLVGSGISGDGEPAALPPTLILFSDATVQHIVHRFGELVATKFTQDELDAASVKAVCFRKTEGNFKQQVGRHLSDYFPRYAQDASASPARAGVCALIQRAGKPGPQEDAHVRSINAAREAILAILREHGSAELRGATNWRKLDALLDATPDKRLAIQKAVLSAVSGQFPASDTTEWGSSLGALQAALATVLAAGTQLQAVDALAFDATATATPPLGNRVPINAHGRSFVIDLATIAGVKGETHLATLILEACNRRRFDVSEVLPYFVAQVQSKEPHREAQLRNLFVAATRPRRLLAFASHAGRVPVNIRQDLLAAGWSVLDWSA